MDLDDTGYLSLENITDLLGGAGNTQEDIKKMIEEADFEHDGKISFGEFKRMLDGEKATEETEAAKDDAAESSSPSSGAASPADDSTAESGEAVESAAETPAPAAEGSSDGSAAAAPKITQL